MLETIVAAAVFSVIAAVTASGFVRGLRTQNQASAFAYVNDSLAVALEQMTREVRTGSNICFNTTSCSSNSRLSFVNSSGDTVTYCLINNAIERVVNSQCSSGNEITGKKVSINYLRFIIANNASGSGYPPRVTILVGAKPVGQSASIFNVNMQTTVSSRIMSN